ncbi:MAG TPA: hypothetical protein VKF36_21410 [Syntrophorhabdales bacterium]|nr:hypothetical protein [Syntrophorhabdales bacterium]
MVVIGEGKVTPGGSRESASPGAGGLSVIGVLGSLSNILVGK